MRIREIDREIKIIVVLCIVLLGLIIVYHEVTSIGCYPGCEFKQGFM